MFCTFCGKELRLTDGHKFCQHCGKGNECLDSSDRPGGSGTNDVISTKKEEKTVMSFTQYQQNKSKSWFARVKPSKNKPNMDVAINIGLLSWNEKVAAVKPLRGKRVSLRVPCNITYDELSQKALKRFNDFYNNLIDLESIYNLTYENGEEACFLPGTVENFSLKRYKEELGKEYKNITLYLLSNNDKTVMRSLEESPFFNNDKDYNLSELPGWDIFKDDNFSEDRNTRSPPLKKQKCGERLDEMLGEVDGSVLENILKKPTFSSLIEVLTHLKKNVIEKEQFFIVSRRGSSLERRLALWKRESNKSDVHNRLMVHYSGESGIDEEGIHKEFLTDIVADIHLSMFSEGAPRDSMLDVQNHLQDFLIMLEDENVVGYSEVLAYDSEETASKEVLKEEKEKIKQEQSAELTPAGVMKWLTGQDHKPFWDDDDSITVKFNHGCTTANPNHVICFPVVHSCSRELILPSKHMKTFDEFKRVFLLAYCKGQAFGLQ